MLTADTSLEDELVSHLVVDSGPLIRGCKVERIGEKIVTVPGVVSEIRDPAARQRLSVLPYELEQRNPTEASMKFVTEFAKLTGDIRSLSRVDMQVVALTYQLEVELNGSEHLRSAPSNDIKINQGFGDDNTTNLGFYIPKKFQGLSSGTTSRTSSVCEDQEIREPVFENVGLQGVLEGVDNLVIEEDGWTTVGGKFKPVETPVEEIDFEDYDIDSEEDEDEWITPSNIKEKRTEFLKHINVACISTDFAIQNMLLQIGLNVIGVDGMMIKYAKTYVLKCYGCFKICEDCTRQFCPKCGNRTLEKVAVTVDENGAKWYQKLSLKTRTTRGVRYSLPQHKGGRKGNADMPHITEDQPGKKFTLDTTVKQKVDVMSTDFVKSGSPFGMTKVDTRAFLCRPQAARRGNPNEVRRKTGNRKKKNNDH